jgi:redox-sensitive bicupin YhaK (pirin superfamily)
MFWNSNIPSLTLKDDFSQGSQVRLIAGEWNNQRAPQPPPNSWASEPNSDVAIWTVKLPPNAQVTLPPAGSETLRSLYFFEGDSLQINHQTVTVGNRIDVETSLPTLLKNSALPTQILVLQGRPINEPVVQYGPFVMNTRAEIHEAMTDYRKTQFGGWPWDRHDPVHGSEAKRFARHIDGSHEEPV